MGGKPDFHSEWKFAINVGRSEMSIQSFVQKIGDTVLPGGKTAREKLIVALWEKALDGDLRAIKLILDYDLQGEAGAAPLADELQADLEKVYGSDS